ncbi:MAG: hypothetical protein U9R50_00165 [Campylobacterota bacterium]|nr:hypothetical protein [Campylobacterota bacterium]
MIDKIENYLYLIDNAFAEKDEKEILMTYVMIFGGLFALSYLLFWDAAEKSFKTAHAKVIQVEKNIATDKNYLTINPESKIVSIESKTNNIKTQFSQTQENNEYIKFSIEKISELYYDEESWGQYINSISKHAKAEKIQLLELSNKFTDEKEDFGHVLDITIKAHGNYKNTLKFINKLEQSFLVVDLHDFSLSAEEKLNIDLNISVWGITY